MATRTPFQLPPHTTTSAPNKVQPISVPIGQTGQTRPRAAQTILPPSHTGQTRPRAAQTNLPPSHTGQTRARTAQTILPPSQKPGLLSSFRRLFSLPIPTGAKTGTNWATRPAEVRLPDNTPFQLEEMTLEFGEDMDEKAMCTVYAVHRRSTVDNKDLTCIQLDLTLQAPQRGCRFTQVIFHAGFCNPGR
jgi:hypothetical protein